MSAGTLWTTKTYGVANAIRAAAAYGGVKVDVPANYTHFQDNLKPEFLAKFPLGKIPAWEGKDGFNLTEATAIARYVASLAPRSTLLGASAHDAALCDQWLSFAASEINQPTRVVYGLVNGIVPYNKIFHTAAADSVERALKALNGHLESRTFLVNERPTVADFFVAGAVSFALTMTFDAKLRAQYPNVVRHFETVTNHPAVKGVYSEIAYVENAVQYTPPKKEEKPKEKKPAAAAPKAAEKPKKKAEEDDDDDDKPFEEPKPKHPLDLLPKNDFMNSWKGFYSNNETRGPGGAIEWFYKNFDKSELSVWRVDYKYNDELTQVYMSSNLIGGFFNRLDASRKYLFGSVGVLGEKDNSVITGVLIIRGQEIVPVVDVAPDFESYDFKKLSVEDEKDKAFLEAALAWDLEVDGKKWADGKNYK